MKLNNSLGKYSYVEAAEVKTAKLIKVQWETMEVNRCLYIHAHNFDDVSAVTESEELFSQ